MTTASPNRSISGRNPQLCFVSPRHGSGFMDELLEAIAQAVREIGHSASVSTGRYPKPTDETVYVVVPHEYFVVTPASDLPDTDLRRITIGLNVEHPGTATFERAASILPALGRTMDINRDSMAELTRRGIAAEHFQLGYTSRWDHWGGDLDTLRDVDVTYLGTAERRRSRLLASYWRDLDELRVRLLTPPHEPMGRQRVDFLPGVQKYAHLARSRILINLHRERSSAFEWFRVLEALCNGSVVVTEPSTDMSPLIPGRHLVVADPSVLGGVVAALARDRNRETALRSEGYEYVRTALPLTTAAKALVEIAADILSSGSAEVAPVPPVERGTPLTAEPPLAVDTPSWDVRFAGERSLGTRPDEAGYESAIAAIHRARRISNTRWAPTDTPEVFPDAPRADVDVLIVQRPGEPSPPPLIFDVLGGRLLPRRVLLAEDGVCTSQWETLPVGLLQHEYPLGRGLARNRLLEHATADWLLVLDSGMRTSPHLLRSFVERVGEDADRIDVVHCPVGDPLDGMVAALPAEGRRLAKLPYLGSGYLVRRQLCLTLGGWTVDPLLTGLEDHFFWRQLVAGGYRSSLVQQVLIRRMRPEPETRPVDLAPQRAWDHVDSLLKATDTERT